ncbi:MAG TPA: sigma-70 family RNA polymerase sigma factor [bacterium]|nr:sigma-70 family RNA polymerase sigma factor [bacterium]
MDSEASTLFDDWLRRARPRLLRLALSRLGDPGEAEDVVQETVLAVWRRHAAGQVEDLDAYASRAVWQNAIRRKTRRRDWEEIETAEREGAAWAEAEAEDWLESRLLEEAIARLPAPQAAVLRLRFYMGLSFREMAEALSIGLNAASGRTRHALQALRRGLKGKTETGGSHGDESDGNEKRTAKQPARPPLRRRRNGGRGGHP